MIGHVLENRFAVIVEAVTGLLKSHGFKKRGQTFRRSSHDNLEVIEFQRSRSNDTASLRFTLNIGVVSARLARELDLSEAGSADAHLRQRIGDFLPAPDDKWWELSSSSSEYVSEEVLSLLENKVVPYLSEHSSDAALVRLWESGQSPGITQRLCERYLTTLKHAI